MVSNKYVKPFIVGTISNYVGKKIEDQKYNWSVYIRGLDNEDLSYYIKKVTFLLHESFMPPMRIIESAPYEVSEQGWGEFVIGVVVYFHDINIKPVELSHSLRLFADPNSVNMGVVQNVVRKPVVHESYDEFVFYDVSDDFAARLNAGPQRYLPPNKLDESFNTSEKFSRDENLQFSQLAIAHDAVLKQILKLKSEMADAEAEIATYKEHISAISRAGNAAAGSVTPNILSLPQGNLPTSGMQNLAPTTPVGGLPSPASGSMKYSTANFTPIANTKPPMFQNQ